MIKKIIGFVLSSLLLALSLPAEAQQPKRVPRIGYVLSSGSPGSPSPTFGGFRQGLGDLGYVEGKNILIERRYAEGRLDRIPALVNDLVQQNVDIIVAVNNVAIRAAKKATQTIPIVIRSSIDPVAAGYVDSLPRPGGNITGVSVLTRELSAKRVELLKEVLPNMRRLAVLWDTQGPGPRVAFREYEAAAKTFKLNFQSLEVRGPKPDFERVFQDAKKANNEALIIVTNPLASQYRKQVVELATKTRLATLTQTAGWANAGGLMSYALNRLEMYRRLATYVDKILKGTKPADLPIERPTKFEFVINLKTAKQIGVTIPPNVLARADRGIR